MRKWTTTLIATLPLHSCSVGEDAPSSFADEQTSIWPPPAVAKGTDEDTSEANPWLAGFGGEPESGTVVGTGGGHARVSVPQGVTPNGGGPQDGEPDDEGSGDDATVDSPLRQVPELQLTRYFEGSGANKRLHLKNLGPAGAATCTLEIYSNGGVQAWRKIELPSLWSEGEELVLCTTKEEHEACKAEISGSGFNGNDALIVSCDDLVVDSFGRRGEDPGTAWWSLSEPPWGTKDAELVRCEIRRDTQPDDLFLLEEAWVPLGPGVEIEEALQLCPSNQVPSGTGYGGAGGGPANSPD